VLVFTRKLNESIIIGSGVEVKVLRIGRDGVRLGVTAALGVPVHRQEVYNAIGSANAKAVTDRAEASRLVSNLRQRRPKLPSEG
jgi:carbon storage regulator